MKDIFQQITSLDAQLQDKLNKDIHELRHSMIEMFKAASSDKDARRKERKMMVFILERLQDLEKDNEPPYGREAYQKLIDEALRAMDQDIRQLGGFSDFVIEEVVTNIAKLDSPKAERKTKSKAPNTEGASKPIMTTSEPVKLFS